MSLMPPDADCFSSGLWYKIGVQNKIFWWDRSAKQWKLSSCKTLPCNRSKYSNLKYFQDDKTVKR